MPQEALMSEADWKMISKYKVEDIASVRSFRAGFLAAGDK